MGTGSDVGGSGGLVGLGAPAGVSALSGVGASLGSVVGLGAEGCAVCGMAGTNGVIPVVGPT